jgi:hypothetical protein
MKNSTKITLNDGVIDTAALLAQLQHHSNVHLQESDGSETKVSEPFYIPRTPTNIVLN